MKTKPSFRSLPSVVRTGLLLLVPVVAGCSSLFEAKPDATRFYLLSSPSAVSGPAEAAQGATLGLCRIELPAYLRTPSVILRPGGTEVRAAVDARWGEPLDQGIARVLRDALIALPGVRSVVVYPAPQAPRPAYEIAVRVRACEGETAAAGSAVRFAASWEIRATDAESGAAPVAAGLFELPQETWTAGDIGSLTAKLGEAVEALAHELAAALPKPAGA